MAILENPPRMRQQRLAVALHRLEPSRLDQSGHQLIRNRDVEERRDPRHFAGEVCLQVVVVHHQHVGPVSRLPPTRLEAEVGGTGEAIALVGCVAGGDPAVEFVSRVDGPVRIGPADGLVRESDGIQRRDHLRQEGVGVIVPGHQRIAAVPGDVDVFYFVVDRQGVERQMRLQESAVGLRLEFGQGFVERPPDPNIDPDRDLARERHWLGCEKHQPADDALHPGRAAFRIGRDHDVAFPRRVFRPPPAVVRPGTHFAGRRSSEVHGRPPGAGPRGYDNTSGRERRRIRVQNSGGGAGAATR